jgi:cytidine deaminase
MKKPTRHGFSVRIKPRSITPLCRKLYKAATTVRRNAHAPYSHFKVGAALRDGKDRIFIGCNVENASFSGTQCAERAAITSMVASGCKDFKEIVIVTDTPKGCPPCGFCRQVMSEFSKNPRETLVHIANLSGILHTVTLSELIPHAFDAGYFA